MLTAEIQPVPKSGGVLGPQLGAKNGANYEKTHNMTQIICDDGLEASFYVSTRA